jgi:hypothetical protein
MKVFKVLCVIAIAFALTATAYAETQSVRISGDITVRGFARHNFDLEKGDAESTAGTQSSDWASFAQSAVAVQVDADLTDNVGAVIRLVNQRVWGDNFYTSGPENIRPNYNGAVGQARAHNVNQNNDSYNVDIDLAYIELKEFLYSPLTLRIGRQDLWFGRGFIIGRNMQDPGRSLYAPEYTEINSFDAVRATLDYDPWTIDVVYSKISENAMRSDDDMDLAGVNVGYIFDRYNAEAEAYYWLKQSRNPGAGVGNSWTSVNGHIDNDVHTVGARGSFDPIEDWTVALEGAVQFGRYIGVNSQDAERDRHAWAVDAEVECRVFQDDFLWRPVLGVEYIWYSGEKNPANRGTNSDWTGWDPMFRGKFDTAIREFQNVFYATTQASSPSYTNQHQIIGKLTLEPTDDITVNAKYANFWLDQIYQENVGSGVSENTNKHIGQEVDLQVVWDYTEDVSFGLVAAWFYPGNHFASFQDNDPATDVVGTVKLSF